MDNEIGVITNFYKSFHSPDGDKSKIVRAFFLYVLDRKPEQKEYAMLQKVIKDFGYEIVFEALISVRYSSVDLNGNYWGYIISVCKNILKEMIYQNSDDYLVDKTSKLLAEMRSRLEGS